MDNPGFRSGDGLCCSARRSGITHYLLRSTFLADFDFRLFVSGLAPTTTVKDGRLARLQRCFPGTNDRTDDAVSHNILSAPFHASDRRGDTIIDYVR